MPTSSNHFNLVPLPGRVDARPGSFLLGPDTAVRALPGTRPAADLLCELLAPAIGRPLPSAADGNVMLSLDDDLSALGGEGYDLDVRTDTVVLRAHRPAGLQRGVQTLRQLLPPRALARTPGDSDAWELPCAQITDSPRFAWRGAMLDVARHYQPIAFLKRFVDLLAFHKLNVFHLHLTDDQGWRMPVAAYPKLTEIGGRRRETTGDGIPHGGFYTRAELAGLVAYAQARGVDVVPEIEMPGHVRAALAAYPELGNDPDRRLETWTRWGVCDTILGVHDEVLDFCRAVLDEVMDVFPSRHLHIGGEECPTTEWEASPRASRRAASLGLPGPKALHGWFMGTMADHIVARGRTPLGWTENGQDLPPAFTAATWRDDEHGLAAARRGQQIVMAPHISTYLDYPQSDSPHEPAGQPGLVVDLKTVYHTEPAPDHWEPEAAARVLGAQAQLWTEYAPTAEHIEYMAYPRLAAMAEATWTTGRTWPGFQARMRVHQARLDALGVTRRPPRKEVPAQETGS
ncbi:beta-N-acetylhexosaminidase [Spirillospora sp. NPDC048819]|uniref:beta-N-acetylhexosaminidase n=1 Tax=Spirillospora sp. NPDC048819 TaxID=3155268 RepID=UPI0033BFCF99